MITNELLASNSTTPQFLQEPQNPLPRDTFETRFPNKQTTSPASVYLLRSTSFRNSHMTLQLLRTSFSKVWMRRSYSGELHRTSLPVTFQLSSFVPIFYPSDLGNKRVDLDELVTLRRAARLSGILQDPLTSLLWQIYGGCFWTSFSRDHITTPISVPD